MSFITFVLAVLGYVLFMAVGVLGSCALIAAFGATLSWISRSDNSFLEDFLEMMFLPTILYAFFFFPITVIIGIGMAAGGK